MRPDSMSSSGVRRPSSKSSQGGKVTSMKVDHDDEDDATSKNNFVQKLWMMATCEDPTIISFTRDGLSFHVKDPDRLEQEVLPKYFRHSRFQSFVRQLNMYDFKKCSQERVVWIYRHKFFQFNKPHLLESLKRKPSASLIKSRVMQQMTRRTSSGNERRGNKSSGFLSSRPQRPTISPAPSDSGMTSLDSGDSSNGSKDKKRGMNRRPGSRGPGRFERGQSSSLTSSDDEDYYDYEGHDDDDDYDDDEEMEFYYCGESSYGMPQDPDDDLEENEGQWCAVDSTRGPDYHRNPEDGGDGYEEMEQDEDKNDDILMDETTIHEKLIEFRKDEHRPMPPQLIKKPAAAVAPVAATAAVSAPAAAATVLPARSPSPQDLALVVTIPAYTATEAEEKEWTHVKDLWQQAGQDSKSQILSQLPTPEHTAFVSFFVDTAPYTSHVEMTEALQTLLKECPNLASSLRQHRIALDPLANLSNETFLAPSGAGVMTTGHNDRVLRDVLGYGINHLTESVVTTSSKQQENEESSAGIMALKACLAAWRHHAGRLLL